MKMLVDPIRPGEDAGYFHVLSERVLHGRGFTEAVVLDSEARVRWATGGRPLARRRTGEPSWQSRRTGSGFRSNCSPISGPFRSDRAFPMSSAGISYLPRLSRVRLVIVGGGHVGRKVAELAHDADFDIWIVDDRGTYCTPERFPFAERRIDRTARRIAGANLDVDESTFCIIVTRGHHHDEQALYHLAARPARFIGMIGSRRKIRLIFDDLLREGISARSGYCGGCMQHRWASRGRLANRARKLR